jgi:hypothetical protein
MSLENLPLEKHLQTSGTDTTACGLSDEARFQLVCGPILRRIDENTTKTYNAVFVSNGKPSILARLDTAEKTIKGIEDSPASSPKAPTQNTFTPKNVKLKALGAEMALSGYAINDVIRAVLTVVVFYTLVYTYMERRKTDEKMNQIVEKLDKGLTK